MKPTVPEKGMIIRLEGENAVIRMKGNHSCKGCGMGKIGLCNAGDTSMLLIAKNPVSAGAGDTVLVGLDQKTKIKGYFLAYMNPLFGLLAGAVAGHMSGSHLSLPNLDAVGGMLALLLASLFSFRRLKKLDATHMMVVRKVITENTFTEVTASEEERLYLKYFAHR